MGAKIVLETVAFPCVPWVVRGFEILPQPGTWTLPPKLVAHVADAKGIIACPRCATAYFVFPDMGAKGEDDPLSLVIPQWHCNKCQFEARIILKEFDKRKLYCAAYETVIDGVLTPNKEYMHAESEQDATAQFWNGRIAADNVVKLVGVAPVIGYFVQDTAGRKLLVD